MIKFKFETLTVVASIIELATPNFVGPAIANKCLLSLWFSFERESHAQIYIISDILFA